jgi:formate dehydrogenase subunit delta
MSPDEKLIYMANQIAAFFAVQGKEKAASGIADHLNRYWAPHMRKRFLALAPEHEADMDAAVVDALAMIRVPDNT